MNQYQLVMRTGPTPGKTYALSKNEIFLGRDINNEIVINDAEISRRHCRFLLTGEGYALEDMGSTNGSFIADKRLSGQQLLKPGDTIRFGDNVTMVYESAFDPNATVMSRGDVPAPQPQAQPAAQPQPVARPQPAAAPPPVHAQPPPNFAGQVPPSEEAGSRFSRNQIILFGCLGILVLGFCAFAIGLWAVDSFYPEFYCEYVPFLFNGC